MLNDSEKLLEEYHAKQARNSKIIGILLIFVFAVLIGTIAIFAASSLEEMAMFIVFIGLVFFGGYVSSYLIHKSRVIQIKQQAKDIILQYHHNNHKPNNIIEIIDQPMSQDTTTMIKQLEKL